MCRRARAPFIPAVSSQWGGSMLGELKTAAGERMRLKSIFLSPFVFMNVNGWGYICCILKLLGDLVLTIGRVIDKFSIV